MCARAVAPPEKTAFTGSNARERSQGRRDAAVCSNRLWLVIFGEETSRQREGNTISLSRVNFEKVIDTSVVYEKCRFLRD